MSDQNDQTLLERALALPYIPAAKMHATLADLLKFPTVFDGSQAEVGIPYGQATVDALNFMLTMAEAEGFSVKNLDNHVGYIQYGTSEDYIGVLCHLDVVPAGNYWTIDPFGGQVLMDQIVGRGALDDKGPAVASYFALKAIKDAGIPLKHSVRLILGLNEETGSKCIAHYNRFEKPPIAGFTPDADFPVIYAEKGITSFKIKGDFHRCQGDGGLTLINIDGGTVVNMVPDTCEALVNFDNLNQYNKEDLDQAISQFAGLNPVSISYEVASSATIQASNLYKIILRGTSAHASTPEAGVNAISYMMAFLGTLPLGHCDVTKMIQNYNTLIGLDYYGEALGMGLEDEASGKLTLNVGTLRLDLDGFEIAINVRFPVTATQEEVYSEALANRLVERGWLLEPGRVVAPIVHPVDGTLVKTLMSVYRDHTGDQEAKPISIGGGTYARSIPGIVAFGPLFPHSHDTMHQADEYITKQDFNQLVRIYADAIMRLAE